MKQCSIPLLAGLMLASSTSAITPEDATTILFIKQEEKLARDVYLALGEAWGTQVFFSIANSEQQHMDAVDGLIARFALVDTTPAESGVFTIPALTELYAALMTKGLKSETEALEVGVLVEETDIADLEDMIAQIDDAAVDQTLGNLLRGSYNHLAAFSGLLDGSRTPPALHQRREGGNVRLSWETSEAGESGAGAQMLLESSVAGSGTWLSVAEVTALDSWTVPALVDGVHLLYRLRITATPQGNPGNAGRGGPGRDTANATTEALSNAVSSTMLDTPWPDAAWYDGDWYKSWMGWINAEHYPWVYLNGRDWRFSISSGRADGWFWNRLEGWRFSADTVYPWIYDTDDGWITDAAE